MIWVAVDRGARLAHRQGEQELAERWGAIAIEVKDEILERGVRDGVFRQHYETDALDASTLLIPLVRFLPPTDDRVPKTVDAIADELTRDGLVLRYLVEETDDGLHGEEATFTICSFWLVSALSEIGKRDQARELCERLLGLAGSLDLYAEELDADDRPPLGQLPAGVHPPGPDQRRLARDRRRHARPRAGRADGGLQRAARARASR